MYGIYLPPGTVMAERYTVNLYDTEQEAKDDLARVQRRHGTRAFIAPSESRDDQDVLERAQTALANIEWWESKYGKGINLRPIISALVAEVKRLRHTEGQTE